MSDSVIQHREVRQLSDEDDELRQPAAFDLSVINAEAAEKWPKMQTKFKREQEADVKLKTA